MFTPKSSINNPFACRNKHTSSKNYELCEKDQFHFFKRTRNLFGSGAQITKTIYERSYQLMTTKYMKKLNIDFFRLNFLIQVCYKVPWLFQVLFPVTLGHVITCQFFIYPQILDTIWINKWNLSKLVWENHVYLNYLTVPNILKTLISEKFDVIP